jgi:hypothetical protein
MGASWGGGYGYYRPGRCCGGWYGGGYRHSPVLINTGNITIGNTVNIGNRSRVGGEFNKTLNSNIYQRPENRSRNASGATVQRNLQQARVAQGRDNNVFADKHGDLARRVGDGWESREQGQWKSDPALNERLAGAGQGDRDQALQKLNTISPEPGQHAAAAARQQGLQRPAQRQPDSRRIDYDRAFNARQAGAARERTMGGGFGRGGGGRFSR